MNALRRVPDDNGIYHYVERCNSEDYPTTAWIHNPDTSAVSNIDKIYWVWNGSGVVEMDPDAKSQINQSLVKDSSTSDIGGLSIYQNSGRFYCYTSNNWVTDGDDNYGNNYYQFAETGASGAVPVYEWEHQGLLVQKKTTLKQFIISGRMNATDIADIKFHLVFRYPTLETGFINGYDNDGEMSSEVIYDDYFFNPDNEVISGQPFGGAINDIHRRDINLNYTFNRDGFLSLYAKTLNTSTSTRYFLCSYRYDILI